jgi:lipoprotein-anchoring transpeptidase ErfK/SrfK
MRLISLLVASVVGVVFVAPGAAFAQSEPATTEPATTEPATTEPATAEPARVQQPQQRRVQRPRVQQPRVQREQQPRANAPYNLNTPFGILYRVQPRETVPYPRKLAAGTIVVNTNERYLYYVLGDGNALRYVIGVGREGHSWAGTSTISAKREWPDWAPTPNIRKQQPELPAFVKGGEQNPMGARALYLGATLYRIHGTNEPWKIGDAVSSGCIRLTNDDIIDLYNRSRIGATVIVQR